MITKEKLEELIKKKAKVYDAVSKDEINLSNICHIFPIISGKCIMDYKLLVIDGRGCVSSYLLSWLKEDVETACEQSTDNWAECPNCKDKDHQIAVLEKALWLMSKQLDFVYNEECCVYYDKIGGDADDVSELMNDYIKQAEKELEEKNEKSFDHVARPRTCCIRSVRTGRS